MELQLAYDSNATAEIAEAAKLSNFRLFQVPVNAQTAPTDELPAKWEPNSPRAASTFSAVCYLSALHFWRMRRDLPASHYVGLVWASLGSTCIESWMDGPSLQRCGLQGENQPSQAANTSSLFNGMIAPLIPFSFRSVWWYQGECSKQNHSYY